MDERHRIPYDGRDRRALKANPTYSRNRKELRDQMEKDAARDRDREEEVSEGKGSKKVKNISETKMAKEDLCKEVQNQVKVQLRELRSQTIVERAIQEARSKIQSLFTEDILVEPKTDRFQVPQMKP